MLENCGQGIYGRLRIKKQVAVAVGELGDCHNGYCSMLAGTAMIAQLLYRMGLTKYAVRYLPFGTDFARALFM